MDFNLKEFEIPVNVTRIANVHYFEFVNQYTTKTNSHSFYEIVYVDKGNIEVISDNYTGTLSDCQLIIHAPSEHHALHCSDKNAPDVIIIGFECNCSELKNLSGSPIILSPDQKRLLAETVSEGMKVYAPPYDTPDLPDMKKRDIFPFGADQMLKLRLEMFLISVIRSLILPLEPQIIPHTDNKLDSVYLYITEHYKEKITLDNICFLFGLNKTTLCQSFKKEYGITVLNYINKLKIKEAKKLLRENKLSVTEISETLGFNSVHYFCRLFKSTTNLSPKAYTNTVRSKLEI